MQSNKIEEGVKDLTTRLISLDPVEFNSAVNNYFEPNVTFQRQVILLHGATNFKRLLLLFTSLCKDSAIIGTPKWDEKTQTIAINYFRIFSGPALPRWLPFSSRIAGFTLRLNEQAVLHLNADEDGEADQAGTAGSHQKYYVTKVDGGDLPGKHIPFVGFFLIHLLRPLITSALLLLASLFVFIKQHPLSDGIISFVLAAISEAFHATAAYLQSISSKQIAAGERWQKDRGIDLKDMVSKARSTALDTQTTLESRAKAAGIPVDEYKKRAGELYNDARTRVEGFASKAEQQSKKSKPVQHVVGNSRIIESSNIAPFDNNTPVNDSVEGNPGVIASTQIAPLGRDIYKDDSNKTTNDEHPTYDVNNAGATSPRGGHNPRVEGAMSYAEAAHE